MKTMKYKQLGGNCDQSLAADTWDQMVQVMTKHIMGKHPDVAKKMKAIHSEDPNRRGKEMKPKWDATAED